VIQLRFENQTVRGPKVRVKYLNGMKWDKFSKSPNFWYGQENIILVCGYKQVV